MNSRCLYIANPGNEPEDFRFKLFSRYFQVTRVPAGVEHVHWFNWEVSSCLIIHSTDFRAALGWLKMIRRHWINSPAVLSGPFGQEMKAVGVRSGFSDVHDPQTGKLAFISSLNELLDRDGVGSPSPLEIRKKFGSLPETVRTVLEFSLLGLTSREIANRMQIRSQTVDKYKRRALVQMKAKNMLVLHRMMQQSINGTLLGSPTQIQDDCQNIRPTQTNWRRCQIS